MAKSQSSASSDSGKTRSTMEHDPPLTPVERERLSLLAAAIAGPPALWVLQLLILSSFSGYSCFPAYTPILNANLGFSWLTVLDIAVDIAAIVLDICAALVSLRYLRLSRQKIHARSDVLSLWYFDRVCFMAVGGMLSSSGFLAASIFESIASFLVPPCGG